MSIIYIPTREPNDIQAAIIERNESIFRYHGFYNAAGNGYYQWTKNYPEKHKFDDIWINIYNTEIESKQRYYNAAMRRFLFFKWWPKKKYIIKPYKMCEELQDAAYALKRVLEDLVDWNLDIGGKLGYFESDTAGFDSIVYKDVTVDAIEPKSVHDFPPERIVIKHKKER